ncbi:MAG: hypothetical protein EOP84_05735 [Verrucomicrobiaceae bacterium]|nr:MAG: hypothetical protein EOP84_05735 [Verrucomicrobiaceae bacterium]
MRISPVSATIAVALLGLGSLSALSAAELIKADVEEPVLEELMGGCSLKCAFRWYVEAVPGKGGKPQPIKALNDESAQTPWTAPHAPRKGGVGTKLRLVFPKKLPAEVEGETPVYGLDLINGYWKNEELWSQYARVKKVRLYYNDKPLCDVAFADSRRWQRSLFPDQMVRSGDSMTIEILEVYPGKKQEVAISELVLQGAH